jgi:hypothetical protein
MLYDLIQLRIYTHFFRVFPAIKYRSFYLDPILLLLHFCVIKITHHHTHTAILKFELLWIINKLSEDNREQPIKKLTRF